MSYLGAGPLSPICSADILTLLGYIRPRAFEGSKVRVGGSNDGGYVLPCAAALCDALLSIGVGNDVSFDHEFAGFGRFVLQFDHTLAQPPEHHENCLFEPRGWGMESKGTFLSLPDMVRVLQGIGAIKPVLKFDVEGAEYELLTSLSPELLSYFPVIVCEFHDFRRLADRGFYERARAALQVLTKHHSTVHLHANNYRDMVLLGGVPVPDVFELALLRNDCGVTELFQTGPIPGPLDRPNDSSKFDLCLNAFSRDDNVAVAQSRS